MHHKQLTACLLSTAMTISAVQILPADAERTHGHVYINEDAQIVQDSEHHAYRMASLPLSGVSDAATERTILPETFDLRKQGLVSNVKNQGSHSTCWAFAACNAMETNMIAQNPEVDLSEWYLAFYNYNGKFAFPLPNETASWSKQGGNFHYLTPQLTGWRAPVPESLFPYEDKDVLDDTESEFKDAVYHVTDMEMMEYPIADAEDFEQKLTFAKQSIYDGHSLVLSYFSNTHYYDSTACSYYNPGDMESGEYHSVSVVGWDDTFSADNFSTDPGMDGAWLVKNSWGVGWGNYGYFWMSYAETTAVEFYSIDGHSAETPESIYLHDDYAYWSAMSISDDFEDTNVFVASEFTAEEESYLTSAMFYTLMADDAYTITVYTDLQDASDPTSGTAMTTVSGISPTTGYHTVELPEPVLLHAGEPFSVVAEFSGEAGCHIACEAASSTRRAYADGTVDVIESSLTEEMISRNFAQNESFYSEDGVRWNDVFLEDPYENTTHEEDGSVVTERSVVGNLCLRAIAVPSDAVIFSSYSDTLQSGDTISLQNAGGKQVYYSVNRSNPQAYTEPLVYEGGIMTLTAWTEEGTQYSHTYKPGAARLTGMTAAWDGEKKASMYLDFSNDMHYTYSAAYPGDEDIHFLTLIPSSAFDVIIDGETYHSGESFDWNVEGMDAAKLLVTVRGENLETSTYKIAYYNTAAGVSYHYGDVNGDGNVDASDASEILIYAAVVGAGGDVSRYDEDWLLTADYSFDGEADASDASEILIYAAAAGVSK